MLIKVGIFTGLLMFFFVGQGFPASEKKEHQKTEVVETKFDLDQMVLPSPAPVASETQKQEVIFDEQKLMQLSNSLKNAIVENKDLMKDKEQFLKEVKQLRGQHEVDANRFNALGQERQDLKHLVEEAFKKNQEQTQKIKELQVSLDQKTQEWEAKLKKLEDELALQEKLSQEIRKTEAPVKLKARPFYEGGVRKMSSRIQELNRENDQLKTESSKIHYNLGNIFFKQGDYKRAAQEYRQALKWMPYDPANHYNLAFVSGEFLNDQKAALLHYQQYLFLNPNAKDASFVKEKILKARMDLKSAIDSPLNEKSKINDDF